MVELIKKCNFDSTILARMSIASSKNNRCQVVYCVSLDEIRLNPRTFGHDFTKRVLGCRDGYLIYDSLTLFYIPTVEFNQRFDILDESCYSRMNIKLLKIIFYKFNLSYVILHHIDSKGFQGYKISFIGNYFGAVRFIRIGYNNRYDMIWNILDKTYSNIHEAERDFFRYLKHLLYKEYAIESILPNRYLVRF